MQRFNTKDKSTGTPAMGQPPVMATASKPGCQQTPGTPELTLSRNRKVTPRPPGIIWPQRVCDPRPTQQNNNQLVPQWTILLSQTQNNWISGIAHLGNKELTQVYNQELTPELFHHFPNPGQGVTKISASIKLLHSTPCNWQYLICPLIRKFPHHRWLSQ